jgi:hypothetical protein
MGQGKERRVSESKLPYESFVIGEAAKMWMAGRSQNGAAGEDAPSSLKASMGPISRRSKGRYPTLTASRMHGTREAPWGEDHSL